MDINEFLIQATLASLRSGERGDLAACNARMAASDFIKSGTKLFFENVNLTRYKESDE